MTNKKRFYDLMWPQDGPGGVAYAPEGFELWLDTGRQLLQNWVTPTFQVRDERNVWIDYLANNKGLPLCSKKMRDIIESTRAATDLIEWLPVRVQRTQQILPGFGGSEQSDLDYYIVHLLEDVDAIDMSRSIIASGSPLFVVKPYLDLSKVGEHEVFRYKGGSDITVCVSNRVRLSLLEWGCTGCSFGEIAGRS